MKLKLNATLKVFLFLLCTSLLFGQGANMKETRIPTDGPGRPLSVIAGWNGSSYYPLGMSGAIFTRFRSIHVWDVSSSTPSAYAVPAAYRASGMTITNTNSSSYMAVWFALADNVSGATTPDTFYVAPSSFSYLPVQADSFYILQVSSAPEVEVQYGTVD